MDSPDADGAIVRAITVAVLLAGCASAPPAKHPVEPVGRPPSDSTQLPGVIEFEAAYAEPARAAARPADRERSPLGGRRITLDVREVPVRDVLRLLAEEADANIVVADAVTGTVTMKLRNVTLDDAFFAVLQSQGLGYTSRGNIVLIE